MGNNHTNGPWYVNYGSIFNRYNEGIMLDEDIAILIDEESGTLHKVGKRENIEEYFNNVVKTAKITGVEWLIKGWKILTFNVKYEEFDFTPEGYNFNIDEVCTIINWFNNCISAESMKEFLQMSLEEAKIKIEKLQNLGF